MPEIPEHLEQLLRRQGVTDAQLDELRRTGQVASIGGGASISIDGITMSSAGELTPEALAQLRKMHRFMPQGTVEQIEMATGEDIDGDGVVGPVAASAGVTAHDTAQHMAAHRSESTATSGPFVKSSPARSFALPIILVAAGAAAVAAYLATR